MDEEAMARGVVKAPIVAHIYAWFVNGWEAHIYSSWFINDLGINIIIYEPLVL